MRLTQQIGPDGIYSMSVTEINILCELLRVNLTECAKHMRVDKGDLSNMLSGKRRYPGLRRKFAVLIREMITEEVLFDETFDKSAGLGMKAGMKR